MKKILLMLLLLNFFILISSAKATAPYAPNLGCVNISQYTVTKTIYFYPDCWISGIHYNGSNFFVLSAGFYCNDKIVIFDRNWNFVNTINLTNISYGQRLNGIKELNDLFYIWMYDAGMVAVVNGYGYTIDTFHPSFVPDHSIISGLDTLDANIFYFTHFLGSSGNAYSIVNRNSSTYSSKTYPQLQQTDFCSVWKMEAVRTNGTHSALFCDQEIALFDTNGNYKNSVYRINRSLPFPAWNPTNLSVEFTDYGDGTMWFAYADGIVCNAAINWFSTPELPAACRLCDPVAISRSGSAYYLLSGWCLLTNLCMCNPMLLSGLFIIGLLAFIFIKLKFSK